MSWRRRISVLWWWWIINSILLVWLSVHVSVYFIIGIPCGIRLSYFTATAHPWHEGVARTRTLETHDFFFFFLNLFLTAGKTMSTLTRLHATFTFDAFSLPHLHFWSSNYCPMLENKSLVFNITTRAKFSSAKTLFRIASSMSCFLRLKQRRFNWPDFLLCP